MKNMTPFVSSLLVASACTGIPENKKNALPQDVELLSGEVCNRLIPDKRVTPWDVDYDVSGKMITVKGATTSAEAKSALLSGLEKKVYGVRDSPQPVPDSVALGGKIYGIVNLSACNMRVEDDLSSEMTTQALMGMPVRVLQRRNQYHIQTSDNYIVWVYWVGTHPVTKTGLDAWSKADKIVVTSHYGSTYQQLDEEFQPVPDVVVGSRLKYEGTQGGLYKASYPNGRQAYISQPISMPEKEWCAPLKQDASSIIRTAYTTMGIPYLWAGTSSKGVDCSGFVCTVLFMYDIITPRDASQQAHVGEYIDIVPDLGSVQPGDLTFFGWKATIGKRERVVHVAIHLGDKKFIHSQGDVHVSSFDPSDADFDEYNLNRLLYAVRVLPPINKEAALDTIVTNPYHN